MRAGKPKISVVIPAHGRPAVLARVLRALRDQHYPSDDFEVVVVDDGSPTLLEREVDAEDQPARIVWLRNERVLGDRRSRDAGVAAAGADFLIVLDSDMIPQPQWLQSHLDAHEGVDRRAVTGHFCHDPTLGWWHPNAWVVAGREAKMRSIFPAAMIRGSATTANMSMKRAVYEAACEQAEARLRAHLEFDATMNVYGWKDIEFISSLALGGVDLRYSWSAWAWHWDNTSLDGYLIKSLKAGIGTCRYCVLYPDLMGDVLTDVERSVLTNHGTTVSRESLRMAWAHICSCRVLLKARWSVSAYRHFGEATWFCRMLGLEVARRQGFDRLTGLKELDLPSLERLVRFVEDTNPPREWGPGARGPVVKAQ